jgi:putative oxidoreductase
VPLTTATTRWQSSAPQFLALLRIVTAWIFLLSGAMKLFGWPMHMPEGVPPVTTFSQIWWAGVLETIGGPLLMLGLCTRPVAFILSGEMAVAYWQFTWDQHPFFPIMSMVGVPTATCCFIWLYISAAGPGAWSLDALLARKQG